MQTKPFVIYIAGYGRSGSSALSRSLLLHPAILSGGELGRLRKYIAENKECACGENVDKCIVWKNANSGSISDIAFATTEAGFDILVDSSKTTYIDFLRPLKYKMHGYDLLFIHLVRPLVGVMSSVEKGTNKDLETGSSKRRRLHFTRSVLGYCFAHIAALALRVFFQRTMTVYHSEMLTDLPKVAKQILEKTNINLSEISSENISGISGQHEIAGNRLLRKLGQ
ncbi:hypothetical protein [Thalassospira alkalitolerans]|uniref:hypothetical protein n=1 Tax=Thalassospira alkalitolerans TaxID=1293890 RepID=UPI003AA9B418